LLLRPGITIQHSREESVATDSVRSDITCFIGVIPRARWPRGADVGDLLEKVVHAWEELATNPVSQLVDPVTLRGVMQFFENGGIEARVLALCVPSEEALLASDPASELCFAMMDRLRTDEEVGLLACPLLAYLPISYESNGRAIVRCQPFIEMLVAHCREMPNRFLVLDTPRGLHEEALVAWVRELRETLRENAAYCAIYYPWLMQGDAEFPPSGAVTGLFARVEHEHRPYGVHWPPANQVLKGVTHPAVQVRWREADGLIDEHINPILTQPTRGVVVWGARTLSSDPRWAHVNSRRIVSLITEQIRRDSEWAVFENQRPELWEIITRVVRGRLDQMWTAGLLTGEKAGSEYLVQCDAELNPPEVRDAGQVHVRVQLRPISTAEFIVVELRLGE
jgi:hypothetical protein